MRDDAQPQDRDRRDHGRCHAGTDALVLVGVYVIVTSAVLEVGVGPVTFVAPDATKLEPPPPPPPFSETPLPPPPPPP